MPEEQLDDEQTNDGEPPEPPALHEMRDAAIGMARFLRAPADVVTSLEDLSTEEDLAGAGMDTALDWLSENHLDHLEAPMRDRLGAMAEAAEGIRLERERTDRDARFEEFKRQHTENVTKALKETADEYERREFEARLAQERRANNPTPEEQEEQALLQAITEGRDAAAKWRRGELTTEAAREVTSKGLEAAAQLERGPSFRINREALDAAVTKRLDELEGV